MEPSVVLRIENTELIVDLQPLMSWACVAVRLFESSNLEKECDGGFVASRIDDAWRPLNVAVDPSSARREYDLFELAGSRRSLLALAACVSCALDDAARAGLLGTDFEDVFGCRLDDVRALAHRLTSCLEGRGPADGK
ncbi:MAG: hypothetical protein U0230_09910 [Polyangiales bacterium]